MLSPLVREGLQRKSFFAACGKKDWSGKPGPAARGHALLLFDFYTFIPDFSLL
jgi:hypothetical protein